MVLLLTLALIFHPEGNRQGEGPHANQRQPTCPRTGRADPHLDILDAVGAAMIGYQGMPCMPLLNMRWDVSLGKKYPASRVPTV